MGSWRRGWRRKEQGRSTMQVCFRIPKDLHATLSLLAKAKRAPLSHVVAETLERALVERRPPKPKKVMWV
jgi:predicted HicB family RNase H-like nuclease